MAEARSRLEREAMQMRQAELDKMRQMQSMTFETQKQQWSQQAETDMARQKAAWESAHEEKMRAEKEAHDAMVREKIEHERVQRDMQERQRAEAARAEQRRYEQQQLADQQNARNEQMAKREAEAVANNAADRVLQGKPQPQLQAAGHVVAGASNREVLEAVKRDVSNIKPSQLLSLVGLGRSLLRAQAEVEQLAAERAAAANARDFSRAQSMKESLDRAQAEVVRTEAQCGEARFTARKLELAAEKLAQSQRSAVDRHEYDLAQEIDTQLKHVERLRASVSIDPFEGLGSMDEGPLKQLLAEMRDGSATRVWLQCDDIGDGGVRRIADALRVNTSVRMVLLRENNVSAAGIAHLADALAVNRSVSQVYLRANRIGDAVARSLATMLAVNDQLAYLELENNGIGDAGARFLADAIAGSDARKRSSGLRTLYLRSNHIGAKGGDAIGRALGTKLCPLTILYLDNNELGSEGVTHLSSALIKAAATSLLQVLCLDGNNAGPNGARALAEALRSHRTLKQLYINK